jgi:hypothetical protein
MNSVTRRHKAIDRAGRPAYLSRHERTPFIRADHDDLHGRAAVAHALIEA